jgi:iron complex outermembrane receptor protein
MLKELMIRSTLIAFVCSVSFAAHAMADPAKPVDVPAGNLVPALEALAKQEAVELLYQPEQLKSFYTHGVKGSYTPQDAVRLLLKGTPLELRTDPSGAMVITPARANTSDNPPTSGSDQPQEGKKSSSDGFLVAQATPGQTPSPSTVEKQDEKSSEKKKEEQLQVVVVTGSRIPTATGQAAQDVKIYTSEQIEQSGQTTAADFLNTLPIVSTASVEAAALANYGQTTVQLRGLPAGTTLILINGRRVEPSGATFGSFFDLNNIPTIAIERIEILPEGSSAIYGSDALAGVVNIILKKNFEGFAADAHYGSATGTDETSASATWGNKWERGGISIIGSYMRRSALDATTIRPTAVWTGACRSVIQARCTLRTAATCQASARRRRQFPPEYRARLSNRTSSLPQAKRISAAFFQAYPSFPRLNVPRSWLTVTLR